MWGLECEVGHTSTKCPLSRIRPFAGIRIRGRYRGQSGHALLHCICWYLSASPPKADMCRATEDVCYGPIADSCVAPKRKTASRRSLRNSVCCIHAASATAFLFLRQPSRPRAPRPALNSGRAAGSGVVTGDPPRDTSDWTIPPGPFRYALVGAPQ